MVAARREPIALAAMTMALGRSGAEPHHRYR